MSTPGDNIASELSEQPSDEVLEKASVISTPDNHEESSAEILDSDPSEMTVVAAAVPVNVEESGIVQECRICLMTDEDTLVNPCKCTGSLAYTHLNCLKAWVRERANVVCEICTSKYADSLLSVLEPEARAGEIERIARATAAAVRISASRERRDHSDEGCGRFAMVRALCFVIVIAVIGGLLLFLGLNSSNSLWAAILLRILAFTLPLFIVFKATTACLKFRRVAQARR